MQPKVVDYASEQTPRPPRDLLRLAPFFAVLCAVFALLKSVQYHSHGQLRDEQGYTLLFVALSALCLAITLSRFPRYRIEGRGKLVTMLLVCAIALACSALALWNLSTATVGAKDRLF
jgi:drug/metabolite transporter (DMT)-like permease